MHHIIKILIYSKFIVIDIKLSKKFSTCSLKKTSIFMHLNRFSVVNPETNLWFVITEFIIWNTIINRIQKIKIRYKSYFCIKIELFRTVINSKLTDSNYLKKKKIYYEIHRHLNLKNNNSQPQINWRPTQKKIYFPTKNYKSNSKILFPTLTVSNKAHTLYIFFQVLSEKFSSTIPSVSKNRRRLSVLLEKS